MRFFRKCSKFCQNIPLITEMLKAVTLAFYSILKFFIRDTCVKFGPVSRYLAKLRRGLFRFLNFWSISNKWNCQNFRSSNYFDSTTSKDIDNAPFWQIVTRLSFFWFMANLGQSESRIPDAWFVILTFLLTITLYLTKTENITKRYLTQFSYYYFEQRH